MLTIRLYTCMGRLETTVTTTVTRQPVTLRAASTALYGESSPWSGNRPVGEVERAVHDALAAITQAGHDLAEHLEARPGQAGKARDV